jgi:hypothetical protein
MKDESNGVTVSEALQRCPISPICGNLGWGISIDRVIM